MLCHISGAAFGSYGVSVAAVVTRCHTAKLAMAGQTADGVTDQDAEGSSMRFSLRTVLFFFIGSNNPETSISFLLFA